MWYGVPVAALTGAVSVVVVVVWVGCLGGDSSRRCAWGPSPSGDLRAGSAAWRGRRGWRPSATEVQPLAGDDQVRIGADRRAVGRVEALPAAPDVAVVGDAGERVAVHDGVHLGGARLGLGRGLRLDVTDGPLGLLGSALPELPEGLMSGVSPPRVRPARTEQVGQAPGPCALSTFSATAICWSLVARSARAGVGRAAVRLPGGLAELEPAVVAVAGVDVPVVRGLAGGDLVPGRHVGRVRRCRHRSAGARYRRRPR